jgi:hypothetical protein
MGMGIDVPRKRLPVLRPDQCFPVRHDCAIALRYNLDILHLVVREDRPSRLDSFDQFFLPDDSVFINDYRIVSEQRGKSTPVVALERFKNLVFLC